MEQSSFTSDGRYRWSEGYGPRDTLVERVLGFNPFPLSRPLVPSTTPTPAPPVLDRHSDSEWEDLDGWGDFAPPSRYTEPNYFAYSNFDPSDPLGEDIYHHLTAPDPQPTSRTAPPTSHTVPQAELEPDTFPPPIEPTPPASLSESEPPAHAPMMLPTLAPCERACALYSSTAPQIATPAAPLDCLRVPAPAAASAESATDPSPTSDVDSACVSTTA